jgi:hypothetical protein
MGIIKNYHDKKWTLQFLDVLYNSIDIDIFPQGMKEQGIKKISLKNMTMTSLIVHLEI